VQTHRRRFRILPIKGSQFRSTSHGYSKASFSWRPKGELFGVVAHLKFDLVEFGHSLDQCFKVRCYFKFLPLIFIQRWKEMFVRPLEFDMYINMEPLLGGTFLAAPE
jgi:hypothetical protein